MRYSRREFLKSSVMGAAGIAALGMGASAMAAEAAQEKEVWNGLYDVVIVGFGGAGACAAITAADAGAKVLLIDKAPKGHEGGNTRYCMQVILSIYAQDLEAATTYFKALRGDHYTPSDVMIDTYLRKISENRSWLEGLGATVKEYAESVGLEKYIGEFPEYEGNGAMVPLLVDGETFTSKFWRFLNAKVLDRADSIDIWYGCPVTALIRDAQSGIVAGVEVDVDGEAARIRAKNGVVLSCGGFENNQQMIQDYTQLSECYPGGSLYNTGDGIKMASAIGANLWHMENIMGPYLGTIYPGASRTEFYSGTLMASRNYRSSIIFVGSDGTRFLNEMWYPRHGYYPYHGTWVHTPACLPAWCVFDEKARLNTVFSPTLTGGCESQVESGMVRKADTLDELAMLLGLPEGSLQGTVDRYNRFCAQGEDPEHGRDADSLVAFDGEGPYYALELKPWMINSQGGPERNENAEILDVKGEAIPHLYGAGECGEMFSGIYQGAGNIGGCIAWGRIAGENASMDKGDDLSGIQLQPIQPKEPEERVYQLKENEYIGSGEGICGPVKVKVAMDGDKIREVTILESMETDTFGGWAEKLLPARLVGKTADEVLAVDGVAMATFTSFAIKAAVTNALS